MQKSARGCLRSKAKVSAPTKEGKTADDSRRGEGLPFWIRVLLILVAFGSFTLLAGEWVNATFSLWSRSIPIDFTHAELNAPGVYKLQLTIPVDQKRIFSSQIRLHDADEDKF